MNPGEGTTVIGRTMKLRGDLSGSENLVIEGEFAGTLRLAGGWVSVGPEGRVRADLGADRIVIAGQVEGQLRATASVHLHSTAVVVGDVFSPRLSMDDGALLRGHIDPTRTGEPFPPPPPNPTPGAGLPEGELRRTAAEAQAARNQAVRPGAHLPAALAAAERQIGEASAAVNPQMGMETDEAVAESNEMAEIKA